MKLMSFDVVAIYSNDLENSKLWLPHNWLIIGRFSSLLWISVLDEEKKLDWDNNDVFVH